MSDRVFKLDDFQGGRIILGYTESSGSTEHIPKDGNVIDVPYPAGSLVLFDDRGTIVGPISTEAAKTLAERILEGDQRARTDPRALLTLAAAVHGFLFYPDIDEPVVSSIALETAHV